MYKSYRIRMMLECGDIVSYKVEYPYSVPPEWIRCNRCNCEVLVYAFETREWKAKCTDCRFARWCGQSEETAKEVKRKHYNSTGHGMRIKYDVNPEIYERIRHQYKRRYQIRIPPQPPKIRFPRKKGLDPEEPPF